MEVDVMGENSESGEGLSRGALSRLRRLKPAPAALFLSKPGAPQPR
jgi:hypothetical protein